MSSNLIKIDTQTCSAQIAQDWMYYSSQESQPVAATLKVLVNGEETFGELYERLMEARYSIEIAIWGFQPSMFFKRDGQSLCIGDVLVEKAMEGVEVKVLVWGMWWNMQTWTADGEANLGNYPNGFVGKTHVDGVTEEQQIYDKCWYKALQGNLSESECWQLSPIYQANKLFAFSKSPSRLKLQLKLRRVTKRSHQYPEEAELPSRQGVKELMLWSFPSHHQKTVLIDYSSPQDAVGFVLEHNMVDNYWDDNEHRIYHDELGQLISPAQPHLGRNSPLPLQDVSALVSGEVLWYLNANFCQSWDRSNSVNHVRLWDSAGNEAYNEKFSPKRNREPATFFPPRKALGKLIRAQILRTYDEPVVEDIRKMYLQNITKTAHFIYTENQYFRWSELVLAYKQHWQKMKSHSLARKEPIYWFVVTNSTDAGIGKGTHSTHEMLKALGRRDVMPGVATALDEPASLKDYEKYDKMQNALSQNNEAIEKEFGKENPDKNAINTRLEQRKGLEEEFQQNLQNDYEKMKQLKEELSDEMGIRAHICTLVSKEDWQEVYVHSKVTIIDDVFLFIGSANLNTRSMQVDSELGIISECAEITQGLRQRLWGMHTGDNSSANPPKMDSLEKTGEVFKTWEHLMDENRKLRWQNKPPIAPLCEFLRVTTQVSNFD